MAELHKVVPSSLVLWMLASRSTGMWLLLPSESVWALVLFEVVLFEVEFLLLYVM